MAERILHVFDDVPGRVVQAGPFDGPEAARELIERCRARRESG